MSGEPSCGLYKSRPPGPAHQQPGATSGSIPKGDTADDSRESQDVVRRAELVYEQRLKAKLERTHPNYFVAIEPESGDYFLGRTLSEAAAGARKAQPGRRAGVLRVGHRTAVHLGLALP